MSRKLKKATLVIHDTFVDTILNNQNNQNKTNPTFSLRYLLNDYKYEADINEKQKIAEKIIKNFEGFIFKLIKKYNTFDKEDLKQVAYLAIIKAINNYQDINQDPTPYFMCYIEKEIKNFVLNQDIIKIPKTVRKLYFQINKYLTLNPSSTVEEIAEKFNLTCDAVKEILSIPQKNNVDLSVIKSQKIRDLELPLEDKIFIEQIISQLSALERKIIKLLFEEDITKSLLAQKLNISRKHLYTLLNNIKEKIMKKL